MKDTRYFKKKKIINAFLMLFHAQSRDENREQRRETSEGPLPLLHAEIVHVPSAAVQLPVTSWL